MGLIRRSYTYLDKNSFRYLFNVVLRPHLVYCVFIWNPLLKKDEELIKNFLHRVSKLIPQISNFSYTDRLCAIKSNFSYTDCLCAINIPSTKYHWIRGNMIQV